MKKYIKKIDKEQVKYRSKKSNHLKDIRNKNPKEYRKVIYKNSKRQQKHQSILMVYIHISETYTSLLKSVTKLTARLIYILQIYNLAT